MAIIDGFKSFNETSDGYTSSDVLLRYLDETCPQWKQEIRNPDCWKDIFEFKVHVLGSNWKEIFAKALFDVIDNEEAELLVFEDENVDSWYRFAAARKLLERHPDTFLKNYENAVRKKMFLLDGWWIVKTNRIFDFPNGLQVAISMFDDEDSRFYATTYLNEVLVENWNMYPDAIKNYIVQKNDYCLREKCTQPIWDSLNISQKFLLAHKIVINEYNYVRDVMSLYEYLEIDEGCRLPIITTHVRMVLEDTLRQRDEYRERNRFGYERHLMESLRHHLFNGFWTPSVDYERLRYNPSEQLTRFQHFAETANDSDIAKMLNNARREIEHSFFDIHHRYRYH